MSEYNVQDVQRVLRLSPATVRGLVKAGFVSPSRGKRRELRFSFQDLIVLRAARALIDASVPRRRINRSLEELRRNLPEDLPLSGLSICAVGDRVVVREGTSHWQADDGQYVLGLDVSVDHGVLRMVERMDAPSSATQRSDDEHTADHSEDFFATALALEDTDRVAAMRLYEQAVGVDACNIAAWVNWGRLLHEQGDMKQAEAVYRRAAEECGVDALLSFNLAVLLEDIGRSDAAMDSYRTAIEADPALADAHYNLARLYESSGRPQHAIRHYGQYRRLLSADQR